MSNESRTWSPETQKRMAARLVAYLRRYRFGAFACSALYYLTAFGPIALTAWAFFLLQSDASQVKTIAAVTAVSGLLSTVGAFGKFQEKWAANANAVYSLRQFQDHAAASGTHATEYAEVFARVQQQHQVDWRAAR